MSGLHVIYWKSWYESEIQRDLSLVFQNLNKPFEIFEDLIPIVRSPSPAMTPRHCIHYIGKVLWFNCDPWEEDIPKSPRLSDSLCPSFLRITLMLLCCLSENAPNSPPFISWKPIGLVSLLATPKCLYTSVFSQLTNSPLVVYPWQTAPTPNQLFADLFEWLFVVAIL